MLTAYGGLSVNDVFYHDPKYGSPIRFGWFDHDELLDALDSYSDALPGSMMPVGDDGGGNLYCLGVTGSDRNKASAGGLTLRSTSSEGNQFPQNCDIRRST